MPIMRDGYSTRITLQAAGAPQALIEFYEKEVKPPGVDAGGQIDLTGMRNIQYRTRQGKALKTITEVTAVVAYDPTALAKIIAIAGKNALVTVTYPNGETITFWGVLDKFDPSNNVEGTQPTATITIFPTNIDNNPARIVEMAPTFTGVP